MKRLAALAAPILLLSLAACGGGSSDTAKSSATAAATKSTCKPLTATSVDEKAVMAAPIAGGLKIAAVQEIPSTADSAMRDLVVRVCGATTAGDALKVQANAIGKALKSAADAKSISSVRVSNIDLPSDPRARVRCEDFQMNTFEGAAGTELATWKSADES